ncbi:transposase [Streptomyces sp. NPDC058434]|uniref:transposase n=1 Tax=Streptomyces sp. NPDC058434 TaxID=3346498 RepID=UPI003669C369
MLLDVLTEPDILPEAESRAGIDLGLSAFALLSEGRKLDSPRFLRRAEKRRKRLQREVTRKGQGIEEPGRPVVPRPGRPWLE